MQLDERKWKILQAIIKTYLETGEPVGSICGFESELRNHPK